MSHSNMRTRRRKRIERIETIRLYVVACLHLLRTVMESTVNPAKSNTCAEKQDSLRDPRIVSAVLISILSARTETSDPALSIQESHPTCFEIVIGFESATKISTVHRQRWLPCSLIPRLPSHHSPVLDMPHTLCSSPRPVPRHVHSLRR